MKTLVLIRHAKSLHDTYVKTDSERHLSARGYEDALQTSLWCKKQGLTPDLIVSSPAIRAYTTAFILANSYGYPSDSIILKPAIYDASSKKLIYVVNELKEEFKTIFLFGHNPGFSDLVNLLCGPVITHLPTAGVAVLEINANKWSEVSTGMATLKTVYSSHKDIE